MPVVNRVKRAAEQSNTHDNFVNQIFLLFSKYQRMPWLGYDHHFVGDYAA
jgi:hypothetical protein